MKKTTLVALLLLSTQCFANSIKDSLNNIESEWASIYYSKSNSNKSRAYNHLLDKIIALSEQHTDNAELIFWQAVVKATNADHQDGLAALNSVKDARKLLAKAIEINPKTMNGSAYVTLGTLYYMVPKWPIAFGDEQTAQKMLAIALQINPNGIDSNYFYGKFLLSQNKSDEAAKYFERAVKAPARNEQLYADSQLKTEASLALKNAKEQKVGTSKNLFLSLFSSATLK